ncbi:hypothetical protein HY440_00165 [Candidatus Microgenomates bacterium]|nr:hypothetical protein [Candidatus Microgenomates bacterium]
MFLAIAAWVLAAAAGTAVVAINWLDQSDKYEGDYIFQELIVIALSTILAAYLYFR